MKMTDKIKSWRNGVAEDAREFRDEASATGFPWWRSALWLVGVYLLVVFLVGWYWTEEPSLFDVSENTAQRAERQVAGSTATATLITVIETLLEKRGGYLSNDIAPPGIWLDNLPNWEYGVIIQVRDFSKAMREAFSRSRSQSTEDGDLALAEPRLNFDHHSWVLPATESEYRAGIRYLESYLARLADDNTGARFYPRADSLRYWLGTVETRLGSLSQRLSASVGQRRINMDQIEVDRQDTSGQAFEVNVKTPWLELDDVFYEARGTTWALVHLLKAVEVEFDEVLRKKNARVGLQQIIRELESSQETVYSPMVLNGGGFGLVANHSLVMASYVSRANASIIDLRDLLDQG